MNGSLVKYGSVAFFAAAVVTACTFGQVAIDFNGQSGPLSLGPTAPLTFNVYGPPGAPFAAMISSGPRLQLTNYGILLVDPYAAEAYTFLDAIDSTSPTYNTAYIPGMGGPYTQVYLPFKPGGGYAPAYYIQAIVADPANPFGWTLSNALELSYAIPGPGIISIEPNAAPPMTAIHIGGTDFATDPALNTVTLNGQPLQVLEASYLQLTVMIPFDAQSGPIGITTPNGSRPEDPDSVDGWLAVVPAFNAEDVNLTAPVTDTPVTVFGSLQLHDTRDYVVHLEAGEEIVAEVYPYDGNASRITGQSNTQSAYFDPVLRIRRNPDAPVTVLVDDNSGPGVAAGIGLAGNGPHYVAPYPEDIVVQVDTHNGQSAGHYMLLLRTRPAANLPVAVHQIFPSDARVGDMVTVAGSGFDVANPAQNTVILQGATVAPDLVQPGLITFTVPPGARSGPVVISSPAGTSTLDFDSMTSWLCVHAFTVIAEVEGTIPTVPVGCQIIGSLIIQYDVDDYMVNLTAGQQIAVECYATDAATGLITTAQFLDPNVVDPEVRIYQPFAPYLLLATDLNSGPGLNAGFGLHPGNPPFTAPYTGAYRIHVSSFFSYSRGGYMLVINPVP